MELRLTLKRKYDKLKLCKISDDKILLLEKPRFSYRQDLYFFNSKTPLKEHNLDKTDKYLNDGNLKEILNIDSFMRKYNILEFNCYTNEENPTLKEICDTIPNKVFDRSSMIYMDFDKIRIGDCDYFVPFIDKYCYMLKLICVNKRYDIM